MNEILILKPEFYHYGITPSQKQMFNPETMTQKRALALTQKGHGSKFRKGELHESTNLQEAIPGVDGYTVGQKFHVKTKGDRTTTWTIHHFTQDNQAVLTSNWGGTMTEYVSKLAKVFKLEKEAQKAEPAKEDAKEPDTKEAPKKTLRKKQNLEG